MDKTELQKIVLAALLHDIGKFAQRAEVPLSESTRRMENMLCKVYKGRYSHRHVLWTSEFFELYSGHPFLGMTTDKDSLANLAMHHHNPSTKKQELLKLADWLSSGTDRYETEDEESGKDREHYKKARMHVIFDYLKLDGTGKSAPDSRYELDPLDGDGENIFPTPVKNLNPAEGNKLVNSYGELWDAFLEELDQFPAGGLPNFTVTLQGLLEKYTWCIPSSTMHRPDISLFDHAKTTAAIAAALYLYHTDSSRNDLDKAKLAVDEQDHRFKLVVGDLSGIQDYIFNIANVGVGGTAKRLRARSFFLSALTEIASHQILQRFGLPLTNLIIATGGKFYLLLPNISESDRMIGDLKAEFDAWCMKETNGEVVLNLAVVNFACADFQKFHLVMKKVNDRLQAAKSAPFREFLVAENSWREDRFLIERPPFASGEKLCDCCGRHPGREKEGVSICPSCERDVKLGASLARAEGIQFFTDESGEFKMLGRSFTLLRSRKKDAAKGAWLVQPYNDWHGPAQDIAWKPRFFANHIPVFTQELCAACKPATCAERDQGHTGQPKFFNCLAEASRGRKLLGVFKADVDNLGLIFISGFQDEKERSISRITTLSRLLDAFFTGRIDYLLRSEFPDIYTVYAGGDDLLVLGPWDTVLRFAQRLREEFADFTAGNPAFSLSAGIALVKPRLPIYAAIETAEALLYGAKNKEALGEIIGRNQIAIFDDCCKWDKLPSLMGAAARLAGWLSERRVSMAFVRQLFEASSAYQKFAESGDTRQLRFVPMLAYSITRNIPAKETEIVKWAHDLTDIQESKNLKNLAFITNFAITANR